MPTAIIVNNASIAGDAVAAAVPAMHVSYNKLPANMPTITHTVLPIVSSRSKILACSG